MDIDELFNPEGPESFDYPLWTIIRAGKVPTIGHPTVDSMMVAVFTDEAAAQRFIEEANFAGAQPLAVPTPKNMLHMLEHYQTHGVKYVAFDLWLHTKHGDIVPIDAFIDGVRAGDLGN